MDPIASSRQRRFWMLERMGAPFGAMSCACGLIGPAAADPQKLVRGADEWLAACRSFWEFYSENQGVVSVHAMLPNPNTELLSVAAKAALSAARAWVENVKTIAMSGKSLARCAVIHAPDETAVVIVAHRVAAGESMLRWMLSRIVQGDPSPVAGRSAPFTIEKSVEAGRVDDLRNVLRGIQEPPELLGDNVRPSVQGLGAHSLRRVVSPDVAIVGGGLFP